MADRYYKLTDDELSRLKRAIIVCFGIPFIDDIEDCVWESVFHYIKDLHLADPITEGRSKLLFDAVDTSTGLGWSLKSLQSPSKEVFELVIQRADVFKKAEELGFTSLSASSDPAELGRAIIRHWNAKISNDMDKQKVIHPRVAILLKNIARTDFTYMEFDYPRLNESDFTWEWTSAAKNGLQGFERGQLRLRWYPGQKQLFERFTIPAEAVKFSLNRTRLRLEDFGPVMDAVIAMLSAEH